MNLRPVEKEKHVGSKHHFLHKYQTKAEEFQDKALLYRRIGIWEGDISLPLAHKFEKKVRKLNKRRVDDVQEIIQKL